MSKLQKRQLELQTLTSRDLDGVEMGVLEDGTSFLTGRGLAAVCGVAPSVINQWANEYDPNSGKKRDVAISRALEAYRFEGDSLYIKTRISGQGEVNAYPEAVCMAVLEYYAFEVERNDDRALQNYRVLARAGLRAFVYTALGYDPGKHAVHDAFASYHERLLLNKMPAGYFSVFSETAHIVLASIQHGLPVDHHTVPDISVGQVWSRYWADNLQSKGYGERIRYPHNYPDSYPQAAADVEAWIYPIEALGVFRRWLDEVYLPTSYPNYLKKKAKAGALPASRVELLLAAVAQPSIGPSSE